MEKGYYNHIDGYWQTTGNPPDEILKSYREGTVEIPVKPSADHRYLLGEWVYVPPTSKEIREKMPPLTARQFRLGLVDSGYAPFQVTQAIAAMPAGPDKERAQIEWEYATTFNRMHPLIATVAAALGLSDEQVDAMWLAAASL